MLDYEKVQKRFNEYLKNFDINDTLISLKIRHTYKVVELSEFIAKDLNLSEEDVELAKIIGLLHDIGRFEQAKIYHDYRDNLTVDHAKFGCKLLFEDGIIYEMMDDRTYDDIIYKAIWNHNLLKIEDGLDERSLLHSKIIRDADKADNFRVKEEEKLENVLFMAKDIDEIENAEITDKVYNSFKNKTLVINTDRVTPLDHWFSYLAFLFDFNFNSCLKYINENDYVNKNINKINYKNSNTKVRVEELRNIALEYVNSRI